MLTTLKVTVMDRETMVAADGRLSEINILMTTWVERSSTLATRGATIRIDLIFLSGVWPALLHASVAQLKSCGSAMFAQCTIYNSRSPARCSPYVMHSVTGSFFRRLLQKHAKKAMKEEKAFLRSLRAEAKAKEDR